MRLDAHETHTCTPRIIINIILLIFNYLDQLKSITVSHDPVSVIPRGLRNIGNLCYIHAVSNDIIVTSLLILYCLYSLTTPPLAIQALLSCPAFYNLFSSLIVPSAMSSCKCTAVTDNM